jgi:hypothetical protein
LQWDKIREYHQLLSGTSHAGEETRNVDFYLDFTVGLNVAFRDANSRNFFDAVINSMKISSIDFYKLANDSIALFENTSKESLFTLLKDPNNYLKADAPIDKALDMIVRNNTFSILVTDGELWKKNEEENASSNPWARKTFADWLDKGNRIDFYITDHLDAGKTKHLYYMIFIPKVSSSEKLPSDDISYFLKTDINAKTLVFDNFSFRNDFYKLKQDYASIQSSGAAEELATDKQSYINDFNNAYEYMDWALDWKSIIKYIRNAKDESTGNLVPGGKDLIGKIYLDAKNSELYHLESIGLKVYDLFDDYSQFEFCKQCQAKPPVFKLDTKGNKELDLNNNSMPIILERGLESCYDENGNLLSERKYNGPKLKTIEELFVLDQKLFNYSFGKDTVGEIDIKIHPNFNGTQLSADRENFVRIDVIMTKCTPNTDNPKLKKFMWEGKRIPFNKGLYESIILAMKDANPEGKVIYSYYIKTLPNNYFE